MAKICPKCDSGVSVLYKCNRCGKVFCEKCMKGWIDKSCPYCDEARNIVKV